MAAGVITKLEPQKNNNKRYSVFVEGEFLLGVDANLIIEYNLQVGEEISEDLIDKLIAEEDLQQAKDAAFSLLSYRQRSRQEIKNRLAEKGYSPDIIRQVISVLEQLDYIDDREFAVSWIRDRISRGFGPYRVRQQLREKGIAEQIIEEQLEAEYDFELEYQLAEQLASKKKRRYRNKSDWETRNKLKQVLKRKGFSFSVIEVVLDDVLAEED